MPYAHLPACLIAVVWLAWAAPLAGQGFSPQEAAARMVAPPGLHIKLFASEPEVRQPILVKCDDRGRLWTIQYLQYPNPAGLTRVQVDRWSRTVYDRVPEPPPHGPRGADRITILQDRDGDGRADECHDFVSGLNLCTGLEFGPDGVYVLQVPYLLFYPDRNRDDRPDAEPTVLLQGFGMEDAQSLANHLTWGPDGWLYGLNGSTTTCRIRGVEFQQGVWRYHPGRDEFELFCEGGGNVFGLTFDAAGELFYSSNGGLFWHALQGGYFQKSFGKHGPLHNPYAYGFLSNVAHQGVTGGPNTGGTVYLGHTFPETYRGAFLTGDFLGHACSWWRLTPAGSTVMAQRGGLLLDPRDTWFGPTDLCLGPDGSLFVSDFYDQRTAHPDPDANWDRSNGRIYKIEAEGTLPVSSDFDLARESTTQLVERLRHPNGWYAQRARCLLAARPDRADVLPRLREAALHDRDERSALQALWALHACDGLEDELALALLEHASPDIRRWTVRLLGDRRHVAPELAEALVRVARTEASPVVRSQLAATAGRLPGPLGLPLAFALLDEHQGDDPRIEWPLWWALEAKAVSDRELLLARFTRPAVWNQASYRGHARRLIRRYAAEGSQAGYAACTQLLQATPTAHLDEMLSELATGLAERARGLVDVGQGGLFEATAVVGTSQPASAEREFAEPTPELVALLEGYWRARPNHPTRLELALAVESRAAYVALLEALDEPQASQDLLLGRLTLLYRFGQADCIAAVTRVMQAGKSEAVTLQAVRVLARLGGPDVTEALLAAQALATPAVKAQIQEALLSRPASARHLLLAVDQGDIPASDIPLSALRQVALHADRELDELVRKHWGNIGAGTSEEKLATMRRLSNDLRAAPGDLARGRVLFEKHCGVCHVLFGSGQRIGPDLTNANRLDREALLANLVDPSAVVRREYLQYVIETQDGRVLAGILAEQDAGAVTIVDAKNQRTRVARDEIDAIRELPASLMPERLWEGLAPQELRDLFHYLQQPAPR